MSVNSRLYELLSRVYSGHFKALGVTVHGFNAMHGSVEFWWRDGWVVFQLLDRPRVGWSWSLWKSPDATPSRAVWGFGPGFEGKR